MAAGKEHIQPASKDGRTQDYGKEVKPMLVRKETMNLNDRALYENEVAKSEHMRAVQDYNIMMGLLEDPAEDDDEGSEEE